MRKCYDKVIRELNEVLKTIITSLSITAVIAVVTIFTAGTFAPAIATALVGSNFAGLSGAALTSACLAYLGGGAIAAGGFGMRSGIACDDPCLLRKMDPAGAGAGRLRRFA